MRRPWRFGNRVTHYLSLLLSRGSGEGFCVFWRSFIGFVVTLAISLPSAFGQDTSADLVLGQGNFTTNGTNGGSNTTNAVGFNLPFSVAIDRSIVPNRVYVSDFNNNRVLGWANISALSNGAPADLVMGQPNFSAGSCNTGGISARSLCVPMGLAVDGAGNLYVVDRGNSRVVVYFIPFTTDAIADRVFGQTNFTSGGCSNPSYLKASAGSVCTPTGVAVDGAGNVYVTDMTNNRALEYDMPLSTDTIADRVFGQSNFTSKTAGSGTNGLNQPYGIAVDGAGNLYIADFGNNRVLVFNTPLTTDSIADRVFGQPNFNNNTPNTGGVSASSLYNPSGVVVDGAGTLYVADRSNNRMLEYDMPFTTDAVSDRVFGQGNRVTTVNCNKGGVSTSSLCHPTGVAVDSTGNIWVADNSNNRVLKYQSSTGVIQLGLLNQARSGHTATAQSDGTVLIAGGQNTSGFLSTIEKFNPQTLVFGGLTAQLQTSRANQSATSIANGSVLAVGGRNAGGVIDTAELYNPSAGQFSNLSGSPQIARSGHSATALLDGRVLIVGGQNVGALDSSEEFDSQSVLLFKPSFDPTAGVFFVLPHALSSPRWDHTATLLPDGRVLIAGGRNDLGYLSTAELFDPSTESFTTLPAVQTTPRAGHTATVMPNGRVLILGGQNDTGYLATSEVFDPALGTFSAVTTGLSISRANHTATLLYSGEILITGGENGNGVLNTAELYSAPSTDFIPPHVVQVKPPNQAVGTDRSEIVGARFSEPVDVRTLNSSTISLTGSGAVDAIIGPSEQGLMVFIVPKAKLSPGTTYTLTLTSGVKDTAGNPLTAITSRFTTVAAPAITNVTPNHGPEGTAITITGQNFDPSAPTRNVVNIKGVAAFVTSATATKLETSVPFNVPIGAGTLEVTTSGGAVATAFTVENPVPTLVRLTPDSLVAGSGVFTLELSGDNFIPASSVSFGTKVLATTFVSGTHLQANLPATAVATAGIFLVTVTNPAPGGGSSAAVSFTVNNPVPNAASLSPTSVSAGVEATTVTIAGTNFSPAAIVQLDGSPLATTFINSMQISASIPASLLVTPRQFTITVVNPSPGGGISAGLVFTVQGSGPRINSISPNQLSQGSVHRSVTITGSGIQPGASVQVSGGGVTVDNPTVSGSYSVADSRSGGPAFSWLDATGGAIALSQCDDCASDAIPIGFPMKVFGQTMTSFYINNNGLISFGVPSDEYQNTGIPLLDPPNFYFAPFWDDLFNGSVYVLTIGSSPNRVTVVQWDHVSTCCDETAASDFTFEILLYETTNVITFQYLTLSGINFDGKSATVGIEGSSGLEGIPYLVSGTPQSHLLGDGLAVTFSPSDCITAGISVVENAPLGLRDVVVTNPDGGTTTVPAVLSITQNPIQLSITAPVPGSLAGRGTILVEGTVSVPSGEVGVAVNGVGAQMNGNRFAANHVPLVLGENTITAVATNMNGDRTSVSVTVTVVEQQNFVELFANPESGTVPLDANFSILTSEANPIVSYALDADGDGTEDFTSSTLPDTIPFSYFQPGLYLATVTVTDDQGNIYSDSIAIKVYSLQELDAMLQSKWSGMKVALTNKDVEGAIRFIAGSAQEMYRQNFTLMMDVLSQIVSDMGPIQFVKFIKNGAIYEMNAVQDGQLYSFYVEFVLDVDGQWKIRFF